MRPLVVKVGGSLLDWPELPGRLGRLVREHQPQHLVFIAGGGPAADFVRALDRAHRLGEQAAHVLALHALDLTAEVLARLVPGLKVARTLDALPAVWDSGQVPVLAPRKVLEEDERNAPGEALPHSWDVTSDTVSARISRLLDASGLLLLKSAPAPPEADLEATCALGLVDPAFASEALGLPEVLYLNLRDPASPPVVLSRNARPPSRGSS